MAPKTITSVQARKNTDGAGWFVVIGTADGGVHVIGTFRDRSPSVAATPLHDVTQVQAEAARWTAAMLLGREFR
jgi:hypothetical protein